jgi:hypothetical protein
MMHGDNWIWVMLAFFIIMGVMRNGRLTRQHRMLRDRFDQLQSAPPPPQAPQLPGASRADVERLEHRVRVLERIVTDSGYSLASQIEALRDTSPAATRREEREIEEKI